jgi:hypothetical protein
MCRFGRWLFVLLFAVAALVAPQFSRAQAQWEERRTTNFAILYPDGAEAQAEEYARFVDPVYDEISATFSYHTPPPVILRIYPTMELYYQANPLAQQLPGVVAHAHTGRREISIALPQTVGQTPDQIVNNVRHELTHIVAADLSENKLTTAWQEGIAQYMERPSAELDQKMLLMQQALAQGRVLSWSDLNRPGVAYADPRLGYPQSYTMVAFLIRRDGFETFRTFIEQTATSSGYRSALEAAYNTSADQLEQEWRAQLDDFVNGAYRNQPAVAFDLTRARALVARGEYAAAKNELEQAMATIQHSEQRDLIVEAEQLLKRAANGLQVQTLAAEAREALERGEYAAAERAAAEGDALLATLNQPEQRATMRRYAELAAQGQAAHAALDAANADLQTLHVVAARARLTEAYTMFTQLGDEANAARAQASLLTIQRTETGAAIGLIIIAATILGWNVHRRVNERQRALPFG